MLCIKNNWNFINALSAIVGCLEGIVQAKQNAARLRLYGLQEAITHIGKLKKSVSGWVVSLSNQVQRDVAQSKILHYLDKRWIKEIVMRDGRKNSPENGVIDYILIENIFGGVSKIGFRSCDQGREKFQGASLDFVWFDEEPPQDIYMECRMRVVDKKGLLFGTMTPLKGLTWVYETIFFE